MLFKDADGKVEVKYVTKQEKAELEEERRVERQIEILKVVPNELALSKHKDISTKQIKAAKKLSKRLNDAKEKNKKVKEKLGIKHKKKKVLPSFSRNEVDI